MNITVTAKILDGKEDNPVEQYIASYTGAAKLVRPDSFLQSGFWTSFKTSHGWQKTALLLTLTATISPVTNEVFYLPFYVLTRNFKRLFTLAYVPLAPCLSSVLRDEDPTQITALLVKVAAAIKSLLSPSTVMIRFDPPEYTSHSAEVPAVFPSLYTYKKSLFRATSDVQPPDSVIIDLTQPIETLLESMKQKWRYNIRLGEKKGVTVTCCIGSEAVSRIDDFYALYGETSARDGIAVHAKSYYSDLLSRGTTADAEVRLYMAHHEGDNLAAIITIFCTTPSGLREAIYLYGASSNTKRNLMPAYSLQWRAMQDAKAAGCIRYDFYGIPPVNDENHPMYGLYRFKTGFGGQVIHRSGSLDVPLKPVIYRLFRLAEKARAFWFKRLKKLFVAKKTA